jgi:hypothetical protein
MKGCFIWVDENETWVRVTLRRAATCIIRGDDAHLNAGMNALSAIGTKPVSGVKYSMKYLTTQGVALPLSCPDSTMNWAASKI